MSRSLILVVAHAVSAAAVPVNNTSAAILDLRGGAEDAFLWSSIALAVFTALLQGLVSVLAFIAEDSKYWTLRFRLAKKEHVWWTFIASLLSLSFILIVISFLAGNTGESVGILAIASATTLAVVQYTVPAWKSRHFKANRWLAWTDQWPGILEGLEVTQILEIPSDWYGWDLFRGNGILQDPTDVIRCMKSKGTKTILADFVRPIPANIFVYDDGLTYPPRRASLLWGSPQKFLPRASRAIVSMPHNLLGSRPTSPDGYACEGVCLALGVLGRNKGLNPSTLVFKKTIAGTTFLEDTSTWAPRPSKVLRSAYAKLMDTQFHGLGPMYTNTAVELSLLLMDCPAAAITSWLSGQFEQQDIALNWQLRNNPAIQMHELNANYRSSYTSMIISLNYMKWPPLPTEMVKRPDLICTGLLLLAEGQAQPSWWGEPEIKDRRRQEMEALEGIALEAAARLLGLESYPKNFEDTWYGRPEMPER